MSNSMWKLRPNSHPRYAHRQLWRRGHVETRTGGWPRIRLSSFQGCLCSQKTKSYPMAVNFSYACSTLFFQSNLAGNCDVPSLVVTGGPYSNTPNGTYVNEVVATTICAHQEYWFTIYDALVGDPTVGDGMEFWGGKPRQVLFSANSPHFFLLPWLHRGVL